MDKTRRYCTDTTCFQAFSKSAPQNCLQGGGVLISVGPITVSWNTMKIALVSGLIVAPVNAALVLIFRYAKPRPARSPMKEYDDQMKYEKKRMKKEEKERIKQMKREQAKKARQPVDVNAVHPTMNEDNEMHDENITAEDPVEQPPEIPVAQNPPGPQGPPKVVHIDTRARRKKFQLPHWFIWVGYALAFATVCFYVVA